MAQVIKAIVIDDEEANIEVLSTLLEDYCTNVKVVGMFSNVILAIDKIPILKPDVLFLDVEMPELDGFKLLDKLYPFQFEIIFVTAFQQYAFKAIKYDAIDYLMKPVSIDELRVAVNRVAESIQMNAVSIRKITKVLNAVSEITPIASKIRIPLHGGNLFQELNEIIVIEADGITSRVYIQNGRNYFVPFSLKEFEDVLPDNSFVRIHHSFIININHVIRYVKGKGRGIKVFMTNGLSAEVSVRKRTLFIDKLKSVQVNLNNQ